MHCDDFIIAITKIHVLISSLRIFQFFHSLLILALTHSHLKFMNILPDATIHNVSYILFGTIHK